MGYVQVPRTVHRRNSRGARRDAASIGSAFDPPRQPSADRAQWAGPVYGPSIDSASRSEWILGRGHENVIARERDGGTMRRVQALLLDGPRCTGILADAKPDRGSRDDEIGTARVGAHLMDVRVDLDGGTPGRAVIRGSWNAADMHIGKQYGAIARCGYRPNAQGRADQQAIDNRRARIPFMAVSDTIEACEALGNAARTDAQNLCIVRPHVDRIAYRHTA
jgi:hypothetical protein